MHSCKIKFQEEQNIHVTENDEVEIIHADTIPQNYHHVGDENQYEQVLNLREKSFKRRREGVSKKRTLYYVIGRVLCGERD